MHATFGLYAVFAIAAVVVVQRDERYPVPPRALPDAEEIALAASAAPAAISGKADVWAVRTSGAVRIREGTNGIACTVIRDLHAGSAYPICFDGEAATSAMRYELLKTTLRTQGKSEDVVQRELDAAFARGALHAPTKSAISYMMSPRQVLFSSPYKEGRRVGAWHPHLMISMPGATLKQVGLDSTADVGVIQLDDAGKPTAQLIVQLPTWSNGKHR